ncbi:lytic transglycosylase domain-containing protein [Vitreoscilla filiformis]|uniref:lytic transglycosylase domain-containing protein n=1 Tax=Vitreoscilla filiformis TaxID=63 RepID=UPI000B7A71F7|nr:lytic transglycosylase domain-containing protein [Vitreoscilla filiformis]
MTQPKHSRWRALAAIVSTLALLLGSPGKAMAAPAKVVAKSAKSVKSAKVVGKAPRAKGNKLALKAQAAKSARAARLARHAGQQRHAAAMAAQDDADAALTQRALAWASPAHTPPSTATPALASDSPNERTEDGAPQPGLRPPSVDANAPLHRLGSTPEEPRSEARDDAPSNAYALWVPAEGATVPLIPIHIPPAWSLADAVRPGTLEWLDSAPEVKALQPVLDRAQATSGVDADFLKALIMVESRFRPSVVSRDGATGLMQISPRTGDVYALPAERAFAPASRRLKIPEHNIITGSRLLSDLFRRYGGRGDLVLAAWNAGEGKVRRAGGQVPAHAGVRNHIRKVFTLYAGLVEKRKRELSMASAKSAPVLLEATPPVEALPPTPDTSEVPAQAPAAPTPTSSEP